MSEFELLAINLTCCFPAFAAVHWLLAAEDQKPCDKCDSLDLWQSVAGNWHCAKCDPPEVARALRERAAELRMRKCQHGNQSAECPRCFGEADVSYDAGREKRAY